MEPVCGKRETLPDQVEDLASLRFLVPARPVHAVNGSGGEVSQYGGVTRIIRREVCRLSASCHQCPSRLFAVMTYTERALLVFWDFAVAGSFLLF